MVTARMREEIDHMLNVKKENKIVLTGLVTKIAMPTDRNEQKKWLMDIVGEALEFLLPGAAADIQFNTPGRKFANGVPTMVETQMKTREAAIAVRKEYAKKKKAKVDMGNLFVANSVTLATRVRTDILKAIGNKCSNGETDMFVVSFTSRPILQVKKKDGSGQYALTFADAVARFGGDCQGETFKLLTRVLVPPLWANCNKTLLCFSTKKGGWQIKALGVLDRTWAVEKKGHLMDLATLPQKDHPEQRNEA